MTADYIDMETVNEFGRTLFAFEVRDGSTRMEFRIYQEDADFIFSKNMSMFSGIIKDEIRKRLGSLYDDDVISFAQYEETLSMMERIL